jgi:hypothetical protein
MEFYKLAKDLMICYLADMKAIPQKTALTDFFCPAYSKANGSISWRVKKAITPPTVIITE